jgi:hypothetical protein
LRVLKHRVGLVQVRDEQLGVSGDRREQVVEVVRRRPPAAHGFDGLRPMHLLIVRVRRLASGRLLDHVAAFLFAGAKGGSCAVA